MFGGGAAREHVGEHARREPGGHLRPALYHLRIILDFGLKVAVGETSDGLLIRAVQEGGRLRGLLRL